MPVLVQTSEYFDTFGNGPFLSYINNAGDKARLELTILSGIRISSLTNPLTLDPSNNTITSSSQSWLDEGFRVGDTVVFTKYDSSGNILNTWSTLCTYVDDVTLDVNSVPYWYDMTVGQFIVIEVPTQSGRGDLEIFLNHVSNLNGGAEFSLIDGEISRAVFLDCNSIAIGATVTGSLTGNQSGQYFKRAELTRNVNPGGNQKSFTLSLEFSNSGIYDESWFQGGDCLKSFIALNWSRETGETSNVYSRTFSETANTGWFGQANNSNTIDSVILQGIDDLDYCVPSTHTIIVDGPLTDIGIGASYIPLDESYYKNKVSSQASLGIFLETSDITAGPLFSENGPGGEKYEITINSISVAGSETTINLTFTPNGAFDAFMASKTEGDRTFYLWVKCGAVNHLAFSDQLSCAPPVGDPLILESEVAFYDHSQNVNDGSGSGFTIEFNTEDDLALWGTFLLDKNKEYSSFSAKIEAFNSSTNADFTLLEVLFSFAGVPISGDGRYLLNQTSSINSILPTTSLKREAQLYLEPSLDTPTQYGVIIYFPVILNWRYWLAQANASVDFWPNQNQNWQQYSAAAPWEVRTELTLNEPSLSHIYNKTLVIKDYDSEPDLNNDISLQVESTSQVVGIIVENQLMRVTATHELLNGNVWNPLEVWGMITVEPFESGPRWICSSTLNGDGNLLNPLAPISGSTITITYPTPNVAKLECFFDPTKINLQNGCKFTSKIKGCQGAPEVNKTTTDGIDKTTTDGDIKTLA